MEYPKVLQCYQCSKVIGKWQITTFAKAYRRELEGAQTVPHGYTDCVSYLQAQDLLGDGWTIDVIAHILKNIK